MLRAADLGSRKRAREDTLTFQQAQALAKDDSSEEKSDSLEDTSEADLSCLDNGKRADTPDPFPVFPSGDSLSKHKQARCDEECSTLRHEVLALRAALDSLRTPATSSGPVFASDSELVTLNVGGRLFQARKDTFANVPDSLLGAMFSGRHSIQPNESGCFFFDRNPNYFEVILDFYRTHTVHAHPSLSVDVLQEEAEYWGMREVMFKKEPMDRFQKVYDCDINESGIMMHIRKHEVLHIDEVVGAGKILVTCQDESGAIKSKHAVVYDSSAFFFTDTSDTEPHASGWKMSFPGGFLYAFSREPFTICTYCSIPIPIKSSKCPSCSRNNSRACRDCLAPVQNVPKQNLLNQNCSGCSKPLCGSALKVKFKVVAEYSMTDRL